MTWKPASSVFHGGTVGVQNLFGKRVRVRRQLSANQFLGAERPLGQPISMNVGRLGFVGRPVDDKIVLAFSKHPEPLPASLDLLMRGRFDSVLVNWPTFRSQFEVEV